MARTVRTRREVSVPSVAAEFRGAELGDARRAKRLEKIADAFSSAPDRSLPEQSRDAAELEGLYRFLNNEAFTWDAMMAPHGAATAARAQQGSRVVVAHDITDCAFPLDGHLRDGYAQLSSTRQGFRLQVSLALAGDGSNRPLGVLGSEVWPQAVKGRLEAGRWLGFIERSAASIRGKTNVVHVIDREGGAFELFHGIITAGDDFVIRLTKERCVELEGFGYPIKIQDAAERLEGVHELSVPLSRRKAGFMKREAPRRARTARISFAAAPIQLHRPWRKQPGSLPATLAVNLVTAREIDPPAGEEPVDWLLATTLPVASAADIVAVVDIYRARWMVEEFFKALKTGCALEKRQLESLEATKKLVAISIVVAWRSLLLRHESRSAPEHTAALSRFEIHVLRETGPLKLPECPTNREALLAVAAIGGHIKNNGDPGWLVLCRGMERFLERVAGFRIACSLDQNTLEHFKALAAAEM